MYRDDRHPINILGCLLAQPLLECLLSFWPTLWWEFAPGKDKDLCLPNTRVNILNQIRAWIDDNDAKFTLLGERIQKAAVGDDGIANKILRDQWK